MRVNHKICAVVFFGLSAGWLGWGSRVMVIGFIKLVGS